MGDWSLEPSCWDEGDFIRNRSSKTVECLVRKYLCTLKSTPCTYGRMVNRFPRRYRSLYIENYVPIIKVEGMMTNWVVARLNDLIKLGHDWLRWHG